VNPAEVIVQVELTGEALKTERSRDRQEAVGTLISLLSLKALTESYDRILIPPALVDELGRGKAIGVDLPS